MPVPAIHQPIVDYFRQVGAAANETEVFDGVTYWTDDQLYEILQQSVKFKEIGLKPVNVDNTVYVYGLQRHYWLDENSYELSGTSLVPTYDASRRTFTFASSPGNVVLVAPFFNLWLALALLWEHKSAQRARAIRVKAGANQIYLEQEYEHCIAQAKAYRSKIVKRHRR
jgi:hypothetical protein